MLGIKQSVKFIKNGIKLISLYGSISLKTQVYWVINQLELPNLILVLTLQPHVGELSVFLGQAASSNFVKFWRISDVEEL